MPFWKIDGLYCVSITTGPTSVALLLRLAAERREKFEVSGAFSRSLQVSMDDARQRILEGTDAANRQHATTWHPCFAQFSIDDSPKLQLLGRAAFAIVAQLALSGEDGFASVKNP